MDTLSPVGGTGRKKEGLGSGSGTWAHTPLPGLKGGVLGKGTRTPGPGQSVVSVFCFFLRDKGGPGRRCLGPQNRAPVRRGTVLAASNLIGRLVEATTPVASIAGAELRHAPVGVAQTRALAATCTSLSPPFSLPPTWRGFIET